MSLGATWGRAARPDTENKVMLVPPTISQITEHLKSAWQWVSGKYVSQRQSKRLKVAETLNLGEKRFVSILQVDGVQFLIGGTSNSVTILTTLEASDDFAQVLKAQSADAGAEKQ